MLHYHPYTITDKRRLRNSTFWSLHLSVHFKHSMVWIKIETGGL